MKFSVFALASLAFLGPATSSVPVQSGFSANLEQVGKDFVGNNHDAAVAFARTAVTLHDSVQILGKFLGGR